jgi:DNA repair protein RadC
MIIREAITKYKKVAEMNPVAGKVTESAKHAYKALLTFMEAKELDIEKEHFLVMILNQKNKIKGIEVVSTGTQNSSLVHSREVFRTAIRDGAAAIIVAHNHPSGNPSPSAADIRVTRQLREASEILGISLLDHVIIGLPEESDDGTGFYSFNEVGLL